MFIYLNPLSPASGMQKNIMIMIFLMFLSAVYIDAGVGNTNPVTLNFVTSGPSFPRNWKVKICQIPCNTIYRGQLVFCKQTIFYSFANTVFSFTLLFLSYFASS